MKKIITIIVVAFTSITIASAGNGININSLISKQLKVPALLKGKKLNEKVNVQFKITDNGKATVLNVETTNPELKSYIISQFPKIDFNAVTEKPTGTYFIDINFKVL